MARSRKYVMKKGDKYNDLTVIQEIAPLRTFYGKDKMQVTRMVLCRCKCNKTKNIKLLDLVSGRAISCGCHKKEIAASNLSNHRNNSNIVNRVGKSKSKSGFIGIFPTDNTGFYYKAVVVDNGARVYVAHGKDPEELNAIRLEYLKRKNLDYKVV